MLNIIKNKVRILKKRMDREYSTKQKVMLVSLFAFFIYLITYFFYRVLLKIGADYESSIRYNTLIIMAVMLLLLSSIPIKIFKDFYENRKIEILILAPISLEKCFLNEFLAEYIKIVLIFLGLSIPAVVADGIINSLSISVYINFFIYSLLLLISVEILSYITIFLLALVFNIKYLKRMIIIYTGLIELIFTCLIIYISNYMDIGTFIDNLDKSFLTKYFYKYSSMMLNDSYINIVGFLIGIVAVFILYKFAYNIFYKSFYINGLSSNAGNMQFKEKNKSNGFLKKYYFFKKDKKLLTRNFMILKSIIFTILTFLITTIFSTDNSDSSLIFLLIVNQFMTFAILAQLAVNIVKLDQDKFEILYMSKIRIYDWYRQKEMSAKIMCVLFSLIYNLIILFRFHLGISEILIYLFVNITTIILFSKPISLISIYFYTSKKFKVKEIFQISRLIIYCIIGYSILTLIEYMAYRFGILVFILTCILFVFIMSKLIDMLIEKFITRRNIQFN